MARAATSRYVPRSRETMPRRPAQARAAQRPPLSHFVLLSILLHALGISLFGAPSGGSREGRAMWGSLSVVLQRAPPEPAPELKIERGLSLDAARQRREAPRAAPAPAKPREPVAMPPLKRDERVTPLPAPPPPAAVAEPAPQVVPPMIERLVTPERRPDLPPPTRVPPPTAPQSVPPAPPVVATPEPAVPSPPAEAPAIAAPLPPPSPPEPAAAQRTPAEAPPLPAPLVQPAAPPIEPAPPVQPAPRPIERAPSEAQPIPAPLATPPVERLPAETRVEPAPAAPVVPPRAIEPPAQSLEPPARAPEAVRTPEAPKAEPKAPPPAASPAPLKAPEVEVPALRTSPFRAPADSPRRDADPNYDPTAAAPSLDADALRRRAGQMAREGTGNRALLPFPMPPQPERKTKEQIAIEKARKPDCRDAYKDLGLAAIVPLIANEFGEGKCRW
jgi:hypothetical protein